MPKNDLDDLRIAWEELNRKLERQNALTLDQVKQNKLARFFSTFRLLILGQTLQLIVGVVVSIISARFWVNHLGAAHLLWSGLFLQGYGIMFIAFAVRDLILIRQIDYQAPVIAIQKQLAQLRAWHIRAAIWHGLGGSVVWLPVLIIVLHLLGTDLWIRKPEAISWLVVSAFVCLAVNYGLVVLSRMPSSWGRALAASWVGPSVNRAQAVLDEIEEFERDVV